VSFPPSLPSIFVIFRRFIWFFHSFPMFLHLSFINSFSLCFMFSFVIFLFVSFCKLVFFRFTMFLFIYHLWFLLYASHEVHCLKLLICTSLSAEIVNPLAVLWRCSPCASYSAEVMATLHISDWMCTQLK
jgi:hypothetical protein